jgi:hypothetical protein
MLKKYFIILFVILLIPIGYYYYTEYQKKVEYNKQVQNFKNRYDEIITSDPDSLTLFFLKKTLNQEGFKEWDQDMINRQISHFYKSHGNDYIILCADMIVFKTKNFDKNGDIDKQINNYIINLVNGKWDCVDSMIVKSFNNSIYDFQMQNEYLNKI